MKSDIRKVAVLGSGVMGSAIAAHLANAGIPSILLDIVPRDLPEGAGRKARNALAQKGLDGQIKARPAAFFHKSLSELVEVGNFDDDLERIAECDWIVEVVIERMDIKRQLFERVDAARRPGTVISSNTSGLSLAGMIEGRSDDFRKNFLITHFFNPPRYMKLLEIVTGPETDPAVTERMSRFFEFELGKGVVFAKDTPNFIANRIGTFSMMRAIHLMLEEGLSIEEVDAIAGTPLGRPKSAAFNTADVVGIDTLAHVARNCYDSLTEDSRREVFKMPAFVDTMVEKGLLGRKTKAGFYKKDKKTGTLYVIDPETFEYREKQKVRYDSIGAARGVEDAGERVKTFLSTDDKASQFAWKVTAETLIYAAERLGEIADDVVNVDRAMRWGFNWDLGPFETMDALGVAETVARLEKDGYEVPQLLRDVAASPSGSFYVKEKGETRYYDMGTQELAAEPQREGTVVIADLKASRGVIKSNDGGSLIDLGDGVALLEFHSKANAIDADVVTIANDAIDEVEKNFEGLVIANDGQNFSVGANLMLLWLESQQENWSAIEEMVGAFQQLCQRLSMSARPVIAATHQMALGGGCEVAMGTNKMVLAAETYMGLVEVGVGLIPGGGGNKEVLRRVFSGVLEGTRVDPLPFVAKAFETVAMATVATSGLEAIKKGYAAADDRVVLSRDRLVTEAKAEVLHLASHGYRPRVPAKFHLPGPGGKATLLMQLDGMRSGGFISDHDYRIGESLATVMTGGNCSPNVPVSEQYLLDIEREQFLSLCGEEKSQARMQHMLMKNKPLRN